MVRNPFRRKKEEKQLEEVKPTDLERICGDDKEIYKALEHTMFLDPRKVGMSIDDAAEKAAEFEKKGDNVQANVYYHIAGGLALWKGDVAKVKQYFGKCAKFSPEMDCELITKIPERAMAKAQEYYREFLK
jgi:hypothetical protein